MTAAHRITLTIAIAAGTVACDDLTKPVAPPEPPGAGPTLVGATAASQSSPAPVPGAFSVVIGVNPFNETHNLGVFPETLLYNVEASGVVVDHRCGPTPPYPCWTVPPDFDAGGRFFNGWTATYGRIYLNGTAGNHRFTRSPYNPPPTTYTAVWAFGGNVVLGRGARDPGKCGSGGTEPCVYSPAGSHTVTFTPTNANMNLEVDSSVVNPGTVANFKVTTLATTSNAGTVKWWMWVPDSGDSEVLTHCPVGVYVNKYNPRSCAMSVYTSGTMYSRVRKSNGITEQQSARVVVRPLTVTADSLDVDVGDTITFRAFLGTNAALITSWRWSGDTSNQTACAGDSVCVKATSDTGTFTMVGLLTAGTHTISDSVTVVVRPAHPTLTCGSTVAWRDSVTCTVDLPSSPPAPFTIGQWEFIPNDALIANLTGPTGVVTWAGKVVTSGWVKVRVLAAGYDSVLTAPLTVERRDGWSWAAQLNSQRGALGEVDACFGPDDGGITTGASCIASAKQALLTPGVTGFDSISTFGRIVGGGPNSGMWYIASPTVTMDLRTQIHRDYRTDGPADTVSSPLAVRSGCVTASKDPDSVNIHGVNTYCAPLQAFIDLVDFIWSHEARHATAALAAARTTGGDLHLSLEPLVARDSLGLLLRSVTQYNRVQEYVLAAADWEHTNEVRFTIWLPHETIWSKREVTFDD